MNLKKLAIATSLALAAMSASATPLDAIVGNLNIKLTGLTTETRTYNATPVSMRNPNLYYESTWGIGAITQVGGTGGQKWTAGLSDGTYLYYMIYGIADQNVIYDANTNKYSIYNVGATAGAKTDGKIHLDIYRSTQDLVGINSDFNAKPSDRIDFDKYNLYSSMGPAYLKITFGTGKQTTNVAGGTQSGANEMLATMVQTVTAATLPAAGEGQFFADVIGGTAMTAWDTNGQFGHDFDGKFTLSDNGASRGSGVCTDAEVTNGTCFTGLINDPIRANKIPEPGSLALFGLALAGLAGVSRRKRK